MPQLIVLSKVKENKDLNVVVGSLIYVSGHPDYPILITQENPDTFLGVKLSTGRVESCIVSKVSLERNNYLKWKGKITFEGE